ncbi:molybdopterin molybdotransferase MoeA [Sulfurospirillum diekertiae]|uniref:Molybdopterin molybdenumtransferase n=1 Tax=Sulfurospirillum diekertiae TaxID=1854492 RepID=A0A1Y0HRH9_9BACT|nr:molybdopterin molybdotransferase MoeA [Sulfurospirillum diekertiae]ARU49914.1 Molybdopterin molybdenumtransferase [Sulfurospirillum diekertiae]ASC94704.1 Molybdopterin molybdenumtransferase [Sulfurospirillum diekertiae]
MSHSFPPFDETLKALENSIQTEIGIENIFIGDALGRFLAVDIVAPENNPTHATSSMDGYAIRFSDQQLGSLIISDFIPAGTETHGIVHKGECVKTFTGTLMSEGSDTLIPIENVDVKEGKIHITSAVSKGFAVRPVGENYKAGEVLIKKGTKIGFAEIGVMAEVGMVQVEVFMKPRIAILSTGNEILDFGEPKTSYAQIRSSNHVTVESILRQLGCETMRFKLIKDDRDVIEQQLRQALMWSDIVITTGGGSVGDFDYLQSILTDMKIENIIDGSYMKPGRHIRVVKTGHKYIYALPGFPYSASVCTFLFIAPLLRKLRAQTFALPTIKAFMGELYKKRSKFVEFTACNLRFTEGQLIVDLHGKKEGSSAILNNLLDNPVLLRVEKDVQKIEKGEMVDVVLLDL